MHMADALISPAVGAAGWASSAALAAYSSRRLRRASSKTKNENNVPLMGVTAAFVFAAQMLNFSIPATGSSGHLGGGLMLAALLGPEAAFLAMASILTVQALFFADGGLLALGCNVFNLGFFPCFVAYPLLFRPLLGAKPTRARLIVASIIAAVVGLELGAFGVVLETLFSGVSALPFGTFAAVMQSIHLAIGLVEGLATAAVLLFVWQARPEVIRLSSPTIETATGRMPATLLAGFLVAAIAAGGILSWFASSSPDGLEWSMARTSGQEELEAPEHGPYEMLAAWQERVAFLPDYTLPAFESAETSEEADAAWPVVDAGTSLAGVVGAALTLLVAGLIGLVIRRRSAAHGA